MKKLFLLFLILVNYIVTFSQTVSLTGGLNDARWGHNAHVLSNGKVLVMGGDNCDLQNPIVYSSAELYDPITKTWSYTNSMKCSHDYFSSVILNNGNVMVIAGMDNNGDVIPTCEIYDVLTSTWKIVSPLQTARENHASVCLQDGRVLVAGGNVEQSCELYDPYSNKWTFTGKMNILHGSGMSLTMLDNGSIIAIGGSTALDIAEIYDPNTEKWTLLSSKLNSKYYYHSVIRLTDGRLLIAGTQTSSYMRYSDLYDQNTQTFKSTGILNTPVGSAAMSLLDDGNVLLYGMGEILNPSNTKCIQIYNVNTGIWLYNTYSFLGASEATATKLHDGTILLVGGSRTTGNGADKICYLVKQTSFPTCNNPNLSLNITGSNGCNGKDATIVISNTESDVKYNASIGNRSVTKPINGNNSDLQITLSEKDLSPNKNIVTIIASKTGCPNFILNDTAIVNQSIPNLQKPSISANGSTSLCNGSSVDLLVDSVYEGYQWNTNDLTSKITVSSNNTYRARVSDNSGCFTQYSNGINVFNYTTATAGGNQSICTKTQPFLLQGMSPIGGVWSGDGVTNQGLFTPSLLKEGLYSLNYSVCNFNVQKTMNLRNTKIKNFVLNVDTQTAITYHYGNMDFAIDSTMYNAKYEVRKDGILLNVYQNSYNSSKLIGNSGSIEKDTKFIVKGVYTDSCGSDTLVKSFTIKMCDNPNLEVGTHTPYVCYNKTSKIFIVNSEKGVTYTSNINGVHFNIETLKGNGDTLFFTTDPITKDATYYFKGTSATNSSFNLKQEVTIHVSYPQPSFSPNTTNPEVGEKITVINTTNATNGKFNWQFFNNASIQQYIGMTPNPFSYNSVGLKTITLQYIDSVGCQKLYSRTLNVIENNPQQDCNHTVVSNDGKIYPQDIIYDNENNSILLYRGLSSDVGQNNYSTSILASPRADSAILVSLPHFYNKHVLVKYNAKGIIQWKNYLSFYWDSWGSLNSKIVADSNGNIYGAYEYFPEYVDSVRAYSTNGKYKTINFPRSGNFTIIFKYNSYGILEWIHSLEFPKKYFTPNFAPLSVTVDSTNNFYVLTNGDFKKYDTNGNLVSSKKKNYTSMFIADDNNFIISFGTEYIYRYKNDSTLIDSVQILSKTSNYGEFGISGFKYDVEGNIYCAGYYSGEVKWKNTILTTPKYYVGSSYYKHNSFICKLSKSLKPLWIKRFENLNGFSFDIKNNKIVFSNSTYETFSYNDSTDFINPKGVYVGITDTSAKGNIQIRSLQTKSDFSFISFLKKDTALQLCFILDTTLSILGQQFSVTNNWENINATIMQLKLSCLFSHEFPNSKFEITTEHQCSDTVLQFSCISDGEPNTFEWSFPGAMPSTSNNRNPKVIYKNSGLYPVSLKTTNKYGSFTNTQLVEIDTIPSIIIKPDTFCSGSNDVTTIKASGAIDYVWSGTLSGNGEIKTMTYLHKDTTVTVTGSSIHHCFTTTKKHLIKVYQNPTVAMISSPITVCDKSSPIQLPKAIPKEGSFDAYKAIVNGMFDPKLVNIGKTTLVFRYTDANGCMDSALTYIYVNKCVQIDDNSTDSIISIFPNPCNQLVHIQSDFQINSIVLVDSKGQEMYREKFNFTLPTSNIDLNMSTYSSGIYQLIVISNSGKEIHRKLIKQ